MAFPLDVFVDKNLVWFLWEFELSTVTCWSVTIIFVNQFFRVSSENKWRQFSNNGVPSTTNIFKNFGYHMEIVLFLGSGFEACSENKTSTENVFYVDYIFIYIYIFYSETLSESGNSSQWSEDSWDRFTLMFFRFRTTIGGHGDDDKMVPENLLRQGRRAKLKFLKSFCPIEHKSKKNRISQVNVAHF